MTPTPQSPAGPRNRGSLGQYRSLWLAHQDGWSASEILAYWYGADITVENFVATSPPAPAPPAAEVPEVPGGLSPAGLPPQISVISEFLTSSRECPPGP